MSKPCDDSEFFERNLQIKYIKRICDRVNEIDPIIHALTSEPNRFGRLIDDCKDIRERYNKDERNCDLLGMRLGVKDIIHVDGLVTRAGSSIPPEIIGGPEAKSVTKLKKAGCLVVGKTRTAEFAANAPPLTKNPHDLSRTPGGSSSGSAAVVAANLCDVALGTQTSGSVIRPASYCGVFAMVPTNSRISNEGVIPYSKTIDTIGIFAKDLNLLHKVASTLVEKWKDHDLIGNSKPNIGIPCGNYVNHASENMICNYNSKLTKLKKCGYDVSEIQIPSFDSYSNLLRHHNSLILSELAKSHKDWYEEYSMFYRKPTAEKLDFGGEITDKEVTMAKNKREELEAEIANVFVNNKIDLLVAPSSVDIAPKTVKNTGNPIMNFPWTFAGNPIINIPLWNIRGLPYGIQLIGTSESDEELINMSSIIASDLNSSIRPPGGFSNKIPK